MASQLLCCNIGWQNGKSAVCSAELVTGGRVLVFLHAARSNKITMRGRNIYAVYIYIHASAHAMPSKIHTQSLT